MFPGSFYLLAMWYRRAESQKRFTFFFSSTTLAGAFGGLLASAIGKMDGVKGYRGWRWYVLWFFAGKMSFLTSTSQGVYLGRSCDVPVRICVVLPPSRFP